MIFYFCVILMKVLNKIAAAFFLFVLPHFSGAQPAGMQLFDETYLHTIKFEADNLEDILIWEKGFYVDPVKMIIDGQVVDSVYLRRKGYTSNEFNETNPPFKIDIDHFVEHREFDGIDKFNLHNHHVDSFYQRNALAYHLYRRAGVAAPRTAFAEVYINNTFIDIYTITEDVEKTFLKTNFASNEGSLYKGQEFPFNSVSVQEGTIDAYNKFINELNNENMNSILNIHNFFRVIAVDLIIKDWDAYSFGSHNYYLYHEPKSGKLNLITWDHNFAFPLNDTTENSLFTSRPPLAELIAEPVVKKMYLETFCKLMAYLIDDNFINFKMMRNYEVLSSNRNELKIPDPAPITQFVKEQRQWFLEALRAEGYSNCNQLISPVGKNDLVINEFVARNNENGIIDPDGGTADWIELYNTTNQNITLTEDFYLSDSEQFPKKWHFTADTVLPSNGYLILWADRDVHQQGIHTNFKLSGSGGTLILSHENTEILQHVDYEEQLLNHGFARIPNGFGEFIIQPQTFSSNNGTTGFAIEKWLEAPKLVYPNPATDKLYFKGVESNIKGLVRLINSMGITALETEAAFEIDISGLPAGLYIVHLKTDDKLFLQTIVIQD